MLVLDRDLQRGCRSVAPTKAAGAPQICVVFATRGRPSLLGQAVAAIERQTCRPASIIVSCPSPDDAAPVLGRPDVTVLCEATGLAAQRNVALRQVARDTDIVVFFDDDFLPRADWLECVAETFARHPDIGAVTGDVIADGIKGPGLSVAEAEALIAGAPAEARHWMVDSYVPYGCNMAFRWSVISDHRFDERLVLYGWLEDRDFGAALERNGARIVKISSAVGVHMGVKSGRVSGRKLGYSQVVNPLYLYRKGNMPLGAVADHLFRNIASNLGRAFRPEPYVDRRGRLYGNLRAMGDILRGSIEPERAGNL
ncbi:glycosyltransferase family 2 protein [Lichenifustis flavocetrariae]|uniref:Glycosyltransferase n=1 Tax=Lichenifustis flavocetrariae TaxID=2949735 RepID=A0AA41YXD1_9HYPH|nr:glycosyltransferase family 2 protein [Lichenifustis flavocetrariae]MCW6509045.1 glycosyltransferase [Lichenifustis flavocetrariae]